MHVLSLGLLYSAIEMFYKLFVYADFDNSSDSFSVTNRVIQYGVFVYVFWFRDRIDYFLILQLLNLFWFQDFPVVTSGFPDKFSKN